MTVAELLALLEGCEPEVEVRIMSQEGWPFENAIEGVAVREDFASEECTCDRRIGEEHDEECAARGEDAFPPGTAPNDVFIVEGRQERYGSKSAWEVVTSS